MIYVDRDELQFDALDGEVIDVMVYRALVLGIEKSGEMEPLVIDEDLNVLEGFDRLDACIELGIYDIPCVINDRDIK